MKVDSGTGIVTVNYQNTFSRDHDTNYCRVLLDNVEVSRISNQGRKTISVAFTNGQKLRIAEQWAILRLNSVTFDCTGSKQGIDLVLLESLFN